MFQKLQKPTQDSAHRRRILQRKAILGVILAILAMLFVACGSDTADTAEPDAAAPEVAAPEVAAPEEAAAPEAVEVEFWDMVWGPPEYVEAGGSLVEQFNAQSDGVHATYQSTPWTNWYQTFLTAIGSGTAPDLSTGAGYQAVQFFDQGAILEIDDVIAQLESSGQADDFLPGTLERLQYDGHTVALPWAIDIRLPWYRADLFEAAGVEPPTNWEEFRAAAKALTTGDQYGFVTGGADNSGMHLMFVLMFNNGGGLFNESGELDVMNPRNVEALTFLSDMVADGSVHPGSAGFSNDDARKAFGVGNAAIMFDNPGHPNRYPEQIDNIALLSPLEGPHGDKGTISWVNNVMIYKQTENPEATKQFLLWWSENQKALWTEGNNTQIPARASIAADPYFQDNPLTKMIIDEYIPVGKSTGALGSGISPVLNDIEGEGVMFTLAQDILQGKDVVESLQKAEATLKSLVGE